MPPVTYKWGDEFKKVGFTFLRKECSRKKTDCGAEAGSFSKKSQKGNVKRT